MFSGGDSSDGVNSLNQIGAYGFVNQVAVSKAVAAGQTIDWAQLAQQWIQMRDNTELETNADAVGCFKSADSNCDNFKFEEKGEADMDMDDEEQTDEKATQRISSDFPSIPSVHSNLNQSWLFGDANSQNAPASTMSSQWNPWPNEENLTKPQSNQCAPKNGPTNRTAHIPSLLKMTVPHPNEIRVLSDIPNQTENTSMMDAAKRKGLPAWIREGLEKMEREKQKQLEKEQKNKDINVSTEDNDFNKNSLINSMNYINGVPDAILDEESTDNEETITSADAQTDVNLKKDDEEESVAYSTLGFKPYEQIIADLMIAVRRTLTELLLETTNEEISKVAEETIKIFKSKASSAQVVRKSALSTLTGKLGLAAYDYSSSESDSDNDEHNSSKKTTGQSESDNDSEEEIRNIIRLKRRGFIKTSDEIEERVSLAAAREEEKLIYFMRKEEEDEKEHNRKKQERSLVGDKSSSGHSGHNKGYDKDFGEITETKIQHLNGKRQKDRSNRRERITRFSDNKDKYVALPHAATFLANINSATNFSSGNNSTALPTNSQRQNIPDINGLLSNYTSTGMANALNAADAALEKALKSKASASPDKQSRRHERVRSYNQSKKRRLNESKHSRSCSKSSSSSTSSSSSSSSSDTDSSTSQSSHHSKYKHQTAKKRKAHSSADRHYEKSHKSHKSDRKYSSTYDKRDRESTTSRNRNRSTSSDSEEEYRRRHRSNSHHTRKSSPSRSYTSPRRARYRENSRSQSRSSYSSNNRRQ